MKAWAESFYKSRAWQNCARAYAKSKGGLCERCLRDGIVTAGVIVHPCCTFAVDFSEFTVTVLLHWISFFTHWTILSIPGSGSSS